MELHFKVNEDNILKDKNNFYRLELPANLVERSSGELISPKAYARIYQVLSSESYYLVTSGGHPSSNRWHRGISLEEAKARALKWASKRYKEAERYASETAQESIDAGREVSRLLGY